MTHEDIHFNPFVQRVDEAETCQRRQCPAQTHIGGSPTFDRDEQTHAEKCQSIDEVDRNDVWDAQDHDVPRSVFEGSSSLLNPQPATAGPAKAVSGVSTRAAFMAVDVPFLHHLTFLPTVLARLALRRLRGSP